MKKITTLLFLFFTILSFSQIRIGEGTGIGYDSPWSPYWVYSYSQSIYTAQEIGAHPGTITSIEYKFSGTSLNNSNDLVVYIGLTNKENFSTISDYIIPNTLTEVYSGILPNPSTGSWFTIPLDTPFTYDGTSNLVIAIHEKGTGRNGNSDKFYVTSSSSNQVFYYRNDNANVDLSIDAPFTSNTGISKNKANVILNGLQSRVLVPTCLNQTGFAPTNEACGNFGGVLSWSPNTDEIVTKFKVYVGTSASTFDIANGVEQTANTFTINNTNANTTYFYKIIPINREGEAQNCNTLSFITPIESCYCEANPTSLGNNSINNIQCNNNTYSITRPNAIPYSLNYTDQEFNLYKDYSNPFVLDLVSNSYSTYFRVYIDFNNDKNFEASELVTRNSINGSLTSFSGNINIPSTVAPGTYRMRIIRNSASADNPCYSSTGAIVIDYTAKINTLDCEGILFEAPQTITDCNANTYTIQVPVTFAGSNNVITDGTTTVEVTQPGTYTFGPYPVRTLVTINSINSYNALCNKNLGSFNAVCGSTCDTAITIPSLPYTTTDNTADYIDSVDITVDNIVCFKNYTTGNDVFYTITPTQDYVNVSITLNNPIRYTGVQILEGCYTDPNVRCLGAITYASATSSSTLSNLTLEANKTYYIWVSSYANPQEVEYSFTIEGSLNTQDTYFKQLMVSPNPATDLLTISNNNAIENIEMYDINGRKILSEIVNDVQKTISVNHLKSGVYLLKINAQGKTTTKKVIIK